MKTYAHPLLAGVVLAALTTIGQAITIYPSTGAIATGKETSEADIVTVITPLMGTSTFLYKQDQGASSSEGLLADSYSTEFFNTPDDPSKAVITYINGEPVASPVVYLLVKDGNQDKTDVPAWYLFNLSTLGWDGMEELVLDEFWPNKGAISHVSLYGGGSDVPDGGSTLILLGSAFLATAALRRFTGQRA